MRSTIFLSMLATFLLSLGLVRLLCSDRFARLVLDIPNDRSLHDRPIPRTGGIGLMLAAIIGWWLAGLFGLDGAVRMTALLAGVVALLFLIDDVRGLPVPVRFAAQFAAALAFVNAAGPFSLWLSVLLILGIVWSMNLYNFMDGSNGMAGGMAVIGFGALAVAAHRVDAGDLAMLSGIVAVAAAGFLVWNFDPARIFLGDAGSIPLGFLAAVIGILGWQRGVWPFWLPGLVFAYFIIDSGLTLAKRIIHGEKPWHAHRSHYYQRLIRMGWSHKQMALAAYTLMLATASSALLLQKAGPVTVIAALIAWALILGILALKVDRTWRASPVRGA
ncbi:MAG: MraY family glycosyltransferase [Hyphomicrobiaceae bacterium]